MSMILSEGIEKNTKKRKNHCKFRKYRSQTHNLISKYQLSTKTFQDSRVTIL